MLHGLRSPARAYRKPDRFHLDADGLDLLEVAVGLVLVLVEMGQEGYHLFLMSVFSTVSYIFRPGE